MTDTAIYTALAVGVKRQGSYQRAMAVFVCAATAGLIVAGGFALGWLAAVMR